MNPSKTGGMKIATGDLYRLRHAQLSAQRSALKAQQAEQTLREMLLELEHQYGLLGTNARIDIHTGEVEAPPSNGNRPPLASPSSDGRARRFTAVPAREL